MPDVTCRIPRLRIRHGRCYELAYEGCIKAHEWVLIHGEVNGPHGINRMGHAWLESDGLIYDPVLDIALPRAIYIQKCNGIEFNRYTIKEAAQQVIQSGHYGPWGID